MLNAFNYVPAVRGLLHCEKVEELQVSNTNLLGSCARQCPEEVATANFVALDQVVVDKHLKHVFHRH